MTTAIAIEPRPDCIRDRRTRVRVPIGMLRATRRDANTIAVELGANRHIYAWAGETGDLAIAIPEDIRHARQVEVYRLPAVVTGPRLPYRLGIANRIGSELLLFPPTA